MGQCTGISFVDSTTIKACHIKREKIHKVFSGIATKGKGTLGWFFGFKLHLIINDKGEILSFVITQGNVDDREPLQYESFIEKVSGNYMPIEVIFHRHSEIYCLLMEFILLTK